MKTGSELEQSFRGPSFPLTFLYYFGVAAFIVTIAAMEILHVGMRSAAPYQYGLVFALPFGLINAFTKSSKTLSVGVKNRKKFDKKLMRVLSELNYEPSGDLEIEKGVSYQTFQPSSGGWFAGKVYVAIAAQEAVIASRRSLIKKLAQKF